MRRVAPICELLYLMMSADGECSPSELQVLHGVAQTLSANAIPRSAVSVLLRDFEALRRERGTTTRLEAVAASISQDPAAAEAAFTLAAVMAVADDQVDPGEEAMLRELRELLGIRPTRARELILGAAQIESN